MFSSPAEQLDAPLERARVKNYIGDVSTKREKLILELSAHSNLQTDVSTDVLKDLEKRKNRVDDLTSRLEQLIDKAEKNHPDHCTAEWHAIATEMEEADETSRILSLFLSICHKLENCENAPKNRNLSQLAQDLTDLKRNLNELNKEERYGFRMISSLKARRLEAQSVVIKAVEDQWQKLFHFSAVPDEARSADSSESSALNLEFIVCNEFEDSRNVSEMLEDLSGAAKIFRIYDRLVKEFSESLLQQIFLPVATGQLVVHLESGNGIILQKRKSEFLVTSGDILKEIGKVAGFLSSTVFVSESEAAIDLSSRLNSLIGSSITSSVLNLSIKKRLPVKLSEYNQERNQLCQTAVDLFGSLQKCGIISKNQLMSQDVIDKCYVERRVEDHLIQARRLCLSESLNIPVEIASEKVQMDPKGDDFVLFSLQNMTVSSAISKIAAKSENLLQESVHFPSSLPSVVLSIHNAFSFFLDLIPLHYKEQLDKVPSVGGMYFSSCIFASYQLHILNRFVQSSFHKSGVDEDGWNCCFADLILRFRAKAYDVLDKMIVNFSREVLEAVHGDQNAWLAKISQSQLQSLLDEEASDRGLEVLRKLSENWNGILPSGVHQQAIGAVANEFIRDIINRLIAVEDINANDSESLVKLFNRIATEVEKLVQISDGGSPMLPVFHHVPSWQRFKEITFVVDASMSQIAERWADGQGPLAEHLSKEELKSLVRALFENNEKRARLLNLIR